MKMEKVVTGFLEENCYIIKNEDKKECLIVDPGADFPKIKEKVEGYKVLKILLTHNHFDHVGAMQDVLNKYRVEVYKKSNLEEKEYQLKDFTFKVIFTPGHTADSVTFYFEQEKAMFTGDFLFQGTVGRTDFPTGNMKDMQNSINIIKTYPKDITIYPGHGEVSTLEEEHKNNDYFLN